MISGSNKATLYNTLNYYSPNNTDLHTRTHQFEQKRGQKEAQTFRKKREAVCQDLMFSSNLNPLARNSKTHFEQSFKETYERKKRIPTNSTDPLTLRYEPPVTQPRVKQPFQSSTILQAELEKKYLLPAQRDLSRSNRRYHNQ